MRKLALTIVLFVSFVSTTFAKGPFELVQVGNWKGGAYTNDATGAFNGCTAGAAYQSGVYFAVSVSAKMTWSLGFAHPSWQLTPNEAFPIDLVFDGQQQFRAQLHNAKIVSRSETPVQLASYGAAWKSEEANGFVRIIPTNQTSKAWMLPLLLWVMMQRKICIRTNE